MQNLIKKIESDDKPYLSEYISFVCHTEILIYYLLIFRNIMTKIYKLK